VKSSHGFLPVFDEENLVSAAGLLPVMELAEAAGLTQLVTSTLTVPSANRPIKVRSVLAGMLAGADSIDDLDVLRAGATDQVLGQVRAPSTVGTFLRSFTYGHVEQLGAIARQHLTGLAERVPGLIGEDEIVWVDTDDTVREVHGYKKQGVSYGYNKVKGLNALFTTVSTASSAPVIAQFSLRKGSTRSGKNAARPLARTLNQVKELTGGQRKVWMRGDSAFCTWRNVQVALRHGVWYSFTIQQWPNVVAAISGIDEGAWQTIKYPRAFYDEELGGWVSEAEVAETAFVAFVSRRKSEQVPCRLAVRRVKRLGDAPTGQGELFPAYRYHAFITNAPFDTVTVDRYHRRHAVVEQVIAELKGGPLAHLPSGKFGAHSAWLAFGVIAFNLSRAVAHAAAMPKARMATVGRTVVMVPARLAHTGRRVVMHMPQSWPWEQCWTDLWQRATGSLAPAGVPLVC
jgi:hypothetical protein